MTSFLVSFLVLTTFFYFFNRRVSTKVKVITLGNTPEIHRISDGIFFTPDGVVDFNGPRSLTHAQESHNLRCEFESQLEDSRYDFEEAYERWKRPIEVYLILKPRVESLSFEERLSYIPKWVDYRFDWIKTANKYDLRYGPKPFHVFIACEINPMKSMEMSFGRMRIKKGYIKYTV